MADVAEIFVEEVWIRKKINEIIESDLSCPMRCCGENDMGPCHATMRVRFENERPHSFYQAHHDKNTHVVGCNMDRRVPKTRVSRVDMRCENVNSVELWEKMRKPKKEAKGGPKTGPGPGGGGGNKDSDNPNEKIRRTIESVSRTPSKTGLLAEVLESLRIGDPFMEGHVGDYIIDHRTVAFFRENGIPENRPILVLLRKIAKDNQQISNREKWELVFADCTYDPKIEKKIGKCLQFRVRGFDARKELMDLIERDDSGEYYLVLFCCWKKDPMNINTYIAVGETERVVGRIAIDKCQTPRVAQ